MSVPRLGASPVVSVIFQNLNNTDYGYLFSKVEYKSMINGGYIIKVELADSNYDLLNQLISGVPGGVPNLNYLNVSRRDPIIVRFQLKSSVDGKFPETATKPNQIAFVTSLRGYVDVFDKCNLEFIAVDPASWYLSTGNASGRAYKGNVSQVIKQVTKDYGGKIKLDIGNTKDSKDNIWYMHRMDPKTFIMSLLEWSAPLNSTKTNWIVTQDATPAGYNMTIKEQGILNSKQRGFYTRRQSGVSTIKGCDFIIDNALSIINTKLITHGLSAISGKYFDIINDKDEKEVVVKDSNTPYKQIAQVSAGRSTKRPPDDPKAGPEDVGFTSMASIPEVYSGGDIGIPYSDYIDGKARNIWLRLVNNLFRMKFTVLGHGEWSGGVGLGIDTIYVKWDKEMTLDMPLDTIVVDKEKAYFLTGNWLVYGYHHVMTRGLWSTDIYCARFDYDSPSLKVGENRQVDADPAA